MKTQRPGFTLIELLVVVAIIAVLAALLMPALASARNRAKTVKCANNERQLGVGFIAYANDNQGFFPYGNPECSMIWSSNVVGTPPVTVTLPNNVDDPRYGQPFRGSFGGGSACNPGAWPGWLQPYLGWSGNPYWTTDSYKQTVVCPSNPWKILNPEYSFTYAMNASMFPINFRCSTMSQRLECALPSPPYPEDRATPRTPAGWNKAVNLSDIVYPSRVALLGEKPNSGSSDNPWALWRLPYTDGGVHNSIWMCAATPSPDSAYCDGQGSAWLPTLKEWRKPEYNAFIAAWHNLNMNTLFADGHVEQVSKAKLIEYSKQAQATDSGSPGGSNSSPGGIFWYDGKQIWWRVVAWYSGKWPSPPYDLPQRDPFP